MYYITLNATLIDRSLFREMATDENKSTAQRGMMPHDAKIPEKCVLDLEGKGRNLSSSKVFKTLAYCIIALITPSFTHLGEAICEVEKQNGFGENVWK